nr:zinc finger, CCHC-type [Tanacetum cinerariifolium]
MSGKRNIRLSERSRGVIFLILVIKEDTTRSAYLVNRSPSSATRFKKPIDMLGFIGWLPSIKQGMLVSVKSGEYKKTFIGFGVGTGSMQVLQGVEFEVEPQEDHTFEVEPHRNVNHVDGTGSVHVLQGVEFEVKPQEDHTFEVETHRNVDHVVGSQEVQTQDLIYYHPARDRQQHSAWELFSYREDSNEAAFVVAAVDKIYAHESLTFNNTVAYEVIFKWKAGLKDDMDAWSDVSHAEHLILLASNRIDT